MSDLISRQAAIDAIELVDWYHQNTNKDVVSGANSDIHQAWYKADDIYRVLEQLPSADVVEVVRCKDCKFGFDYYNDGDCYCKIPTGEMVWLGNNWNGYCSYGERKEVQSC